VVGGCTYVLYAPCLGTPLLLKHLLICLDPTRVIGVIIIMIRIFVITIVVVVDIYFRALILLLCKCGAIGIS